MNREKGTTILLTTHDLGDIEDLCERLVIIDQGRIIYDGKLQEVKDAFAQERTLHIQLSSPLSDAESLFRDLPEVSVKRTNDGSEAAFSLSIRFNRFRSTASDIVKRVMSHAEVIDFRIDEPSIEEIIRRVYDGQLDAAELAAAGKGSA
ncbi:Daunorubicin/doxorubicin resistance ATP-binding protein DrrA [compost metagenome]